MKYYLVILLLLIMAAGARTMFEVAYLGMAKEHDFAPDHRTGVLMCLAIWYVLMMVADVAVMAKKNMPGRNIVIIFLSLGVLAPAVYKLVNH
jgi:hypothetical protein